MNPQLQLAHYMLQAHVFCLAHIQRNKYDKSFLSELAAFLLLNHFHVMSNPIYCDQDLSALVPQSESSILMDLSY